MCCILVEKDTEHQNHCYTWDAVDSSKSHLALYVVGFARSNVAHLSVLMTTASTHNISS